MGTRRFTIALKTVDILRNHLEVSGFKFREKEHALWQAFDRTNTITLYKNGTLLIQGAENDSVIENFLLCGVLSIPPSPPYSSWMGTDEAGKGDYFGPLVVAGVLVNKETHLALWQAGIRDSKEVSATAIVELANVIKKRCIYSIVTIGPKRYNELYAQIKNLNKVLGWAHARVIENILKENSCPYVLSDQFGNERFLKNALLECGKNLIVDQQHKAEREPAVAAASILAREEFVKQLDKLSKEYMILFPKGAGIPVISAAKDFINKFGKDKLVEVAKLHFKMKIYATGTQSK